MMEIQQKTLVATLLSAAFLSLAGCGDAKNLGGTGVPASPPAGTQATVHIGNLGEQPLARAVLIDQAGNVMASQEINCQPKDLDCKMYLPTVITQPVTLLLQDKQNRLLSAFEAKAGQISTETIYPSKASTGIYLNDELDKFLAKQGVTRANALKMLENFFRNYDSAGKNIDLFELLADYIDKQRAINPGQTDNEILETLAKRLKNGEQAKPEELPTPRKIASLTHGEKFANAFTDLLAGKVNVIGSAHANQTCSGGLSTFLTVTANLGDALPIVGGAVSGLAGIGQEACDDTSQQLAELSKNIQSLTQTVNSVNTKLISLKGLTETGWINAQTQAFQNVRQEIITSRKDYRDFLNNNPLQDGSKAPDLYTYFQQNGGWTKALEKNGGRDKLIKILQSMNRIVEKSSNVVTDNQVDTFLQALNDKCAANPNNEPGVNFIAKRQACNNAIFTSAAYIVSYRESLTMAQDIFKVLATYQASSDGGPAVYNTIGYPQTNQEIVSSAPSTAFESYSTAYKTSINLFNTLQSEFLRNTKSKLGGEGYFKTYAGLPPELLTNLTKIQCSQPNRSDAPNIIGWYSPSAQPSENYIVTECQIGGRSSHYVRSKYYYESVANNGGYTPVNMMGVPIASGFLNGGGYGDETRKESLGYTNGDRTTIRLPVSSTPYDADQNTFAISVSPLRKTPTQNVVQPFVPECGPQSQGQTCYGVGSGIGVVLKSTQKALNFAAPQEQNSNNFVRYTDDKGESYVWKHRIHDGYTSRDHYMQCLSGGCKITGNGHRLSFDNGPQDVWFRKQPPSRAYLVYEINGKDIE
jgi:hypothetical protein